MGWILKYQDGTIVVQGAAVADLPDGFRWDPRIEAARGPAYLYPFVVRSALHKGIDYIDEAKAWEPLDDLRHRVQRQPRPYQREAAEEWGVNLRRGSVILPTGSGKSFVAEMLIAAVRRPTLIIAPTLDLVAQWHDRMRLAFGEDIGIIGGGVHELKRITVSTYDSAQIHMSRYGNRFAFLIYDEVHHLPSPANIQAAQSSLAPFRLGLTATYEREDGAENVLDNLLGPVVYRKEITELSGNFLADYEVVRLWIELSDQEKQAYREAREEYASFVRSRRIAMGGPNGWRRFLRATSRSRAGRSAFRAYQRSRHIMQGTSAKIEALSDIMMQESGRRMIIFTNDNMTAYLISRRFLIPCITHQTDLKERTQILKDFSAGLLPFLVTSKVLNEGVDLPAAEVGVVLSGSGTVREHVQRLGRLLRPGEGKKALMYELVASDTAEESTSARRRRHDAYR